MSTSQIWPRAQELFGQVVELPPESRQEFLHEQCKDNRELHALLTELLTSDPGPETPWPGLTLGDHDPSPPPVSGYEELELIAHGGMGSVYRARRQDQRYQGQLFAVKVLHAHRVGGPATRRFAKERRLLALLDHPNIVRILDGGELEDGRPFLVTDLIEGEPLDRYCQARRLPIDERLRIFTTFCRALHYAHQNLIVHRDIKPSNLLIDREGSPHLLDFGIAKLLEEEVDSTSSRFVSFTPQYASPEQVAGLPITPTSDIYSAGRLLFELLTGELPPPIGSLSPLQDPPYPSSIVSEASVGTAHACRATAGELRRLLRGDLDHIVAKALRWQATERYGSARELAEDIERHLSHRPILARRGSWKYRTGRFLRRNRFALTASVSALVILGLTLATAIQSWRRVQAGQETTSLIRELAGPENDQLMDSGSLDKAVAQILALEAPRESKSLLLALLSRVSIPEEQLLQRSTEVFAELSERIVSDPQAAELALVVGEILFHGGHFEDSAEVLRSALKIAEGVWGEAVELTPYLQKYARVLAELERYEEGIDTLRRGIRLQESSGSEPQLRSESFLQLSSLYYLQGAFAEATETGQQALELLDHNGGGEPTFRSKVLKGLAVAKVEIDARDPSCAELAREALEIEITHRGPEHMETVHARHNLAYVLSEAGRLDEAMAMQEENLALAEKSLGVDHLRLGYLLTGIAMAHQINGEPANCVPPARRAVDIRAKHLPADNFLTAASQLRLGSCLADLGQVDEATELLLSSLRTFERSEVEDPKFLREARFVLDTLKRP